MSTEVGGRLVLRGEELPEDRPPKGSPAFPQQDLAYRHTLLCGHGVSLVLLEMAEWKELRWKLSPGAHSFMIPRCKPSPAGVLGAIWEPMSKGLGQARSA